LCIIDSDRTPEGARLVDRLQVMGVKTNPWKMALRSRRKEQLDERGEAAPAAADDAEATNKNWRDNLRRNGQGTLFANPGNAITILRNEEAWKGVLAWDDFRNGIVFLKEAPWCADDGKASAAGELWSEDDDVKLQAWLMRRWSFNLGRPDCYAAARVVARQKRVHPVREWLEGLRWDGVKRLDAWLTTYLGVEASPYVSLVGAWWMISAIARIFVPGCKADHAIILEGAQGIAKSTAAKLLFGASWFSDAELDWHSKDKYLLIRGRWGFELAELAGLGKADLDRVKAFLTQSRDDYRGPYEKHTASIERQTVFVGTVNPLADGTYPAFTDPTGNRRWWPVRCGRIDLDALARDRELLWAEAVARYQDTDLESSRWWPVTPEERTLCAGEQEQRAPEEVWQGKIEWWLRQRAPGVQVSVSEVLTDAIKRELKDCTEGDRKRAGICIARAGWTCVGRVRQDGVRERVYQRAAEAKSGQSRAVDDAVEGAASAGT
jgi:predicted P-loop ATPase